MTKKELAERIRVDPKTLKNWETTKPELIKLIHLGLAAEAHIEEVEKYLRSIQSSKQDIQVKWAEKATKVSE
ncbi:MAG: hypothetical protein AB7E49_06805 [Campylobacterales bacterium]